MVSGTAGWECRYFLSTLPPRFSESKLGSVFGRKRALIEEDDYYLLLGPQTRANIKLRAAGNLLKMKRRLKALEDGFEFWETVLDASLPVCSDDWKMVAAELGIDALDEMTTVSSAGVFCTKLVSCHNDVTTLRIVKQRRFYWRGAAQLEVTELQVAKKARASISFESPVLAEARRLRVEFAHSDLGVPKSYVDASREILRARENGASIGS